MKYQAPARRPATQPANTQRTTTVAAVLLLASLLLTTGCSSAGGDSDADTDADTDTDTDTDTDADTDTDTDTGPWVPPDVYEDSGYEQEIADVPTGLPSLDVRALAMDGEALIAGTASGLARLVDDGFQACCGTAGFDGPVDALAVRGGRITVGSGSSVHVLQGDAWSEIAVGAPVLSLSPDGLWVGTETGAGRIEGGQFTPLDGGPQEPVRALEHYQELGMIDIATEAVALATASGLRVTDLQGTWVTIATEHGLPSIDVRGFGVIGSDLYVATAAGLATLDAQGAAPGTIAFTKLGPLPYEDLTRLFSRSGGALVLATPLGAIHKREDRWRYYHSRTWLPEDEVRDVLLASDGTLYFATAGGVSRVKKVPYTLSRKAAEFDALTQARHVRTGYTVTQNRLAVAGDVSSYYNIDDDNDGQWTEQYLVSQVFRYAATGSEEARENARVAVEAMLFLEEVTEVPGFFARSTIPPEECAARQCEGCGEWHLNSDETWCWKGDTSIDEWSGHFFGLPLYYDLIADAEEQARIAGMLQRIVDRSIEYGYKLVDLDGEPTTWGHMDPEFMELEGQFGDAGINSAKMLAALSVVRYMTGDPTYQEHFDRLCDEHDYADYVRRISPINRTVQINFDSEEMSFLAMFTLIRYERDPARLALWREGQQGLWEDKRPDRSPEFNMLHAMMMRPEEYDLDISIRTLRRIPTDLVLWENNNSHRADYESGGVDFLGEPESTTVFPYDERQPMRWSENPYRLDQPGNGMQEASGMFWLLPYWTGRYIGVISAAQ